MTNNPDKYLKISKRKYDAYDTMDLEPSKAPAIRKSIKTKAKNMWRKSLI